MRTLMIGMDGVQVETFQRGWTPYIASLIGKGEQLLLEEDLLSRGWDEILTGEHAITTGAFYDRAVLNGTHDWNTKFKVNDIPGLGTTVKPIWQVLNERGYRVGIMNVPTTSPAPMVEGFFVSGGGGGSAVTQAVSKEQCYPREIIPVLNELGYISDERPQSLFGEKQLYRWKDAFYRLEKMVKKRTQAFIKLSKNYEIDFGFIVYRSTVMAEIFGLPDLHRLLNNIRGVNQELLDVIEHFYQHLDENVRLLVESFSEPEIVLVSDHATTLIKWQVNINTFLRENDFQKSSLSNNRLFKLVTTLKAWTPVSLRSKLGKMSKVRKAYNVLKPFDAKSSLAFCMVMGDWVPGIFINDSERFGGPVSKRDISKLSLDIIQSFNSNPVSIEHGFIARLKPETGKDASPYYPDIFFDIPDQYVITNSSKQYVTEFLLPEGPQDVHSILRGPSLCAKARVPLSVIVNNTWEVSPFNGKNDLRLVYHHILKAFYSK